MSSSPLIVSKSAYDCMKALRMATAVYGIETEPVMNSSWLSIKFSKRPMDIVPPRDIAQDYATDASHEIMTVSAIISRYGLREPIAEVA